METGLLTLLVLSGVFYAFKYTKSGNPSNLIFVSIFLGLAYLTRNDSLIYSVLVWAFIIWETYTLNKKTNIRIPKQIFISIGIYLAFVVGQMAFQYLYYGELMPNTYTLKLTGMPLLARIKDGLRFVKPFLIVSIAMLVLSTAELIFDFHKQKLLLIALVFSAIAFQIYVGGDPWNYWRMMSPFMPLLSVLFICASIAIIQALSSSQALRAYFLRNPILPEKYLPQIFVILLVLIGLLSANVRFLPEIALLKNAFTVRNNINNVNIAITLNEITTNDSTIGIFWAGSIPYYTDRKAIDFLGKSDKYIARLPPDISGSIAWNGMNSVPGHNKYDLDYSIKTLEPTFVQGVQWGAQDLSEWADNKYVKVEYDGISLLLMKNSPAVIWNKVSIP